eukprot:3614396-Prorocentrum_lima.AAC.1
MSKFEWRSGPRKSRREGRAVKVHPIRSRPGYQIPKEARDPNQKTDEGATATRDYLQDKCASVEGIKSAPVTSKD